MRKSLILSTALATTISVASAILAPPATAGRTHGHHPVVFGRSSSAPMRHRAVAAHPRATLSRYTQGLPPSAALAAAKTQSDGVAGTHVGTEWDANTDPTPPQAQQQWDGTHDTSGTPGDATAAVGPASLVQVVNSRIALYLRSGQFVDAQELGIFLGLEQSHCLVEPQVQWDPYTNAYFFTVLDLGTTLPGGDCPVGQESIWYGWSKTKSPSTLAASNWCALHYDDYGADNEIPDSPRLGDTKDFGLIGVNVFGPDTNPALPYLRSDLVAFPKPLPGHTGTCPGSQTVYRMPNLLAEGDWDGAVDGAGVPAFAPIPVTQSDPSSSGYVVATDFNGSSSAPYYGFDPSGGPYLGNALAVFPVTKGGGGVPQVGAPVAIPVTSYLWPRNAFQQGNNLRLDTQEGAPTQAMSGVDPVHPTPGSESGAIWTQQVVRGGGGAMITWYELDPTAPAGSQVLQAESVVNPSSWLYNAAISSDRQVTTDATGTVTSAHYGSAMVLGYDVSGRTSRVTVKMMSKIGDGLHSSSVTVISSTGTDNDESCRLSPNHRLCRWGDYAGAVPDPYYSGSSRGHVWLANQWVTKSLTAKDVDWRTVLVKVWP